MRRSKPAADKERREVKSDLLARAFLDILAREDGVHSKSMLRSGSGDASDPVEILLDDLMDTPAEERMSERPGVVVIGATNHPDMIDPAVKRAGRLDREIEIEIPDVRTLASIFRHHLGDQLPNNDLMPVALAARGSTGADAEAYVRRARGAARRARRPLQLADLLAEVRMNREPPTQEERRLIAVHEAGHAVVATLLGGMKVVGVSVGDLDGLTQVADIDRAASLGHCNNVLSMLMAGRAAEELVLGAASAGAGGSETSDLSLATELAKKIELKFGFGEYGPLYLGEGRYDPLTVVPGLLKSVSKRLNHAMSEAKELLARNRAAFDAVTEALDRNGYLSAAEVQELIDQGAAIRVTELSPRSEERSPALDN